MTGPDVVQAFEVENLEGTYTRRVASFDKKNHRLTYKDVESERGWMVYFPQGHSLHVTNEEELRRLGFDRPADLVDMESGDDVDTPPARSPKERVQRVAS